MTGYLRFRWVRGTAGAELARRTEVVTQRFVRYPKRLSPPDRDAENAHFGGDKLKAGPLDQILSSSITNASPSDLGEAGRYLSFRQCPRFLKPFHDGLYTGQ
jgi:hypothetical protein